MHTYDFESVVFLLLLLLYGLLLVLSVRGSEV